MKCYCLILTAGLLTGPDAYAQLSGIINIPGTYSTLASAVAALNAQGVGPGGVTLNVQSAQTAPLGGYVIGSGILNASTSATRQVVINGNNITAAAGTSTLSDAVFRIAGTDYVTLSQFDIIDPNTTASTQMERGIALVNLTPTDGVQYCRINDCYITLNRTNVASIGIYVANADTSNNAVIPTSATGQHSHDTIWNNHIQNVFSAIVFKTNSTFMGMANSIGRVNYPGNTIQNYGGNNTDTAYGILLSAQDLFDIRGNYINNKAGGGVAHGNALYGICTSAGGVPTEFHIFGNVLEMYGSPGATQIAAIHNTQGTPNGNCKVAITSNYIQNSVDSGNGTFYGIYNNQSSKSSGVNYNRFTRLRFTGTAGTICLYYNNAVSPPGSSEDVVGNLVDSLTAPFLNANTLFQVTNGGAAKTVTSNNFKNISYGAGKLTVLTVGNGDPSVWNKINNNIFDTITTGGNTDVLAVSGSASVTTRVYLNEMSAINTTGTLSAVSCIRTTGGLTNYVFDNTISNISAGASSGTVDGISISGGVNNYFYNNVITDLTAPNNTASYSAICGIAGLGGTSNYLYHNTIYLGGTAGLGGIGATGILYSSAAVNDIRNNIVNVNVLAGAANNVVVIRRSSPGIAGFPPTSTQFNSNNNIYYAPMGPNNYLYAEGTSNLLVNGYATGGLTANSTANILNDPQFNGPCSLYKTFMYDNNGREGATFKENNLSPTGCGGQYRPSGLSFAYQNAGLVSSAIPSITFDYCSFLHPSLASIGALEFLGTAMDSISPVISYIPLPSAGYCVTPPILSAIITDNSGVNITSGTAPRLYYRKVTENNAFGIYPGDNSNAFNGWKYVQATGATPNFSFTMDFSKLASAMVPGDSIVYFVAAQDNSAAANVGLNIVGLAAGFCPASINLPPPAGPTTALPLLNGFKKTPPPLPVISANGSLISTGVYAAYQWALNGVAISGATSPSYNASANGFYTVTVTDVYGCTGTSAPFEMTGVGIANVLGGTDIRIFPNPAKDLVYVAVDSAVDIVIFGPEGRRVLQAEQVHQIDISLLADGLYTIQVTGLHGSRIVQKLIKANR